MCPEEQNPFLGAVICSPGQQFLILELVCQCVWWRGLVCDSPQQVPGIAAMLCPAPISDPDWQNLLGKGSGECGWPQFWVAN